MHRQQPQTRQPTNLLITAALLAVLAGGCEPNGSSAGREASSSRTDHEPDINKSAIPARPGVKATAARRDPTTSAADRPATTQCHPIEQALPDINIMDDIMDDGQAFEPPVESHAWKYLVLHHSATDGGDVSALDESHRQRKDQFGKAWLGIGYHFVIGNGHGMPDGMIESTFRWKEQLHGAHARSPRYNRQGVGICLIGNFEAASPTPRQLAALRQLCEWLMGRYNIDKQQVLRHLDVAATRCPGRLFPFDELLEGIDLEFVTAARRPATSDL